MIYDNIPLIGIEGHVRVETRDALTNKLTQVEEGHNVITTFGNKLFRDLCITSFSGVIQQPTSILETTTYQRGDSMLGFGGIGGIFLTDDDTPPSVNQVGIEGNVTGYAAIDAYTGTDILRGSINVLESHRRENVLKMVYDFGTDRANGTHKSVSISKARVSLTSMREANLTPAGLYLPEIVYRAVEYGDFIYATPATPTSLNKYDKITGAFIETIALGEYAYAWDILDGKLYYLNTAANANVLKIRDLTTGVVTSVTLSHYTRACYYLAALGEYLYFSNNYSTTRIGYRYKISDGTITTCTTPVGAEGYVRFGDKVYATAAIGSSCGLALLNLTDLTYGAVSWEHPDRKYLSRPTITTPQIFFTHGMYSPKYERSLFTIGDNPGPFNQIARKLLDTPVVKNNTQTMKVTYTLNFV